MEILINSLKEIILNYMLPYSPIAFYFFGVENVVKYTNIFSFFTLTFFMMMMTVVFYGVFFLSSFINYHFVLFFVSIVVATVYTLFRRSNLQKPIDYFKDSFYSLIPLGANFIIASLKLDIINSLIFILSFHIGYFFVGGFMISIKEKMILDDTKNHLHIILFTLGFVSLILYGYKYVKG